VSPRTLDHVALWVTERDRIADACVGLGMHVIERTDAFTLVGFDARRGKLTLFDAEGSRERGALKHVAFRIPGGDGRDVELPDGFVLRAVNGDDGDLDHVALYSPDPERAAREYLELGFHPAGSARVEVGGAFVELHEGDPGEPERPLLNHLAVLVDSAEEHRAEAEANGIEVADFVDAPNTIAVFVWGPDRVKIEYVEHKPTFSLV
jgi:catechol 2,3-dioxygenase-like lactoylglutathione lyase family enzyme